jgi:hypothetical protein
MKVEFKVTGAKALENALLELRLSIGTGGRMATCETAHEDGPLREGGASP